MTNTERARQLYEQAKVPHYHDFDDLPAHVQRQYVHAAQAEELGEVVAIPRAA